MKLAKIDPSLTKPFKDKAEAMSVTLELQNKLYDLLYVMFAEGKRSLLVVLHGIDASGKDGVVRHLFDSANPQGLQVHSFKYPTEEELRHDIFWRCHNKVPAAGFASIFNRSYYEEVATVQVHPEYLKQQHLPDEVLGDKDIFKKRYRQIRDFEKMLSESGVVVAKFLLHVSKDEQQQRLNERLKDKSKNWKFSKQDLEERKLWDKYMNVFQKMIDETDVEHAPWQVIPADKKWYRNYLITKSLVERLSALKMRFPDAGRST